MKLFLLIFSLIIIICSCNLNKESTDEDLPRIVVPFSKYYTNFNSKECIQQIEEAKADVSRGKFVFRDYIRHIPRHDEELEELLANHGIEYIFGDDNCTLEQECYAHYMDSIISKNKGEYFIKELRPKADSIFLSRWKTKRYEHWDLDEYPRFDGVDAEIYIETEIVFPKNWDAIPMEFKRQHIGINVYIDHNGKLEQWEFDDFYNLNDSNEKHLNYLQKEISKILSKMKQWSTPTLEGKKVNCGMYLDINLDKKKF